jgi:hypothetical protein
LQADQIHAGFANITVMQGEWIFTSAYFHKTSFAAVYGGQARLGRHIIMDF